MKFILLVAVLCVISNSVSVIWADKDKDKDKDEIKKEDKDFFTSHFERLQKKYEQICRKPRANGQPIVITFETTFTLIQMCLVPEMDRLKKELNKESEANPTVSQEISDAVYPDHWNDIIAKCFKGKVQNFCYRSQEGKVERDPHNQTIDLALICGATKSYAFLKELRELYIKHAEAVRKVASREQKCIDDFFINIEANNGKYVPK